MANKDLMRQAFEKASGLKLNKLIYSGDGEVFTLKDKPKQLVKIVATWEDKDHLMSRFRMLKTLKKINNGAVVKLHKIGIFRVSLFNSLSDIDHYYYYVMDKLKTGLTDAQCNLIEEVLKDGARLPQKVPLSLKTFVKMAKKLPYFYDDIHSGNILKNQRGSLKFIDLESFSV